MDFRIRKTVWDRAEGRCEYCRMLQTYEPIQTYPVDHIIALQHGGETKLGNLCLSCLRCNLQKGPNIATLDPDSGEMVPLFNPRSDRWGDHFEWDGPHLFGKTPIGRGTVECLAMNQDDAVKLRRQLIANGEFP